MGYPRQTTGDNIDLKSLKSVRQGETSSSYAIAAIIVTLAIALKLLRKAQIQSEANRIAT